ncbi:MAG: hypothetical protein ACPGJS_06960 [Flammeovirgaceae bacterium]
MKISSSTELMTNYQQAEVISAQKKLAALQTPDGHTLLFSIGTDNIFYLLGQKSGVIGTGWEKFNLSNNMPVHGTVKTFAVSQNPNNHLIDVAVAVTVGGSDNLLVSLGNSPSSESFMSMHWQMVQYDDSEHPTSQLNIQNIFITSDPVDSREYIVVDTEWSYYLHRYYIDPNKSLGKNYWNSMAQGSDLSPQVKSCIGRKGQDEVSGMYTLGEISSEQELLYVPTYNYWGPNSAPSVTRLQVPSGATALDVAYDSSGYTALFLAGNQNLYYFAADQQQNESSAATVFQNEVFQNVTNLYAHRSGQKYIVWGLNGAGEIFYTTCDISSVTNPSSWSTPIPILKGVEQVTTYVNKTDDGSSFVANMGDGQIVLSTQNPSSTIWTNHDIVLPAGSTISFDSYNTRIQVTDDQNQPKGQESVSISAVHRCQVLINNVPYVLDENPITVQTNHTGGVTVIEKLKGTTAGTNLKVAGLSGSIDPMANGRKKFSQLTTVEALENAQIQYSNVNIPPKPLVSAGVSYNDKSAVTSALGAMFSNIVPKLNPDGSASFFKQPDAAAWKAVPAANVFQVSGVMGDVASATMFPSQFVAQGGVFDFSNAIDAFAGDVFGWLGNVFEGAYHALIASIEGVWHMIIEIAGKAYRFLLHTLAAVAKAIEVILKAIKTFIKDVIDFIKYLFEWKDFVRTKDVFKNILLLNMQLVVDDLTNFKQTFDQDIQSLKSVIDNWAGSTAPDTWTGQVPNSGNDLGYVVSTISKVTDVFSAPAMHVFNYVLDHIVHIEMPNTSAVPQGDQVQSLMGTLVNAFQQEGNIINSAFKRVQEEFFSSSTVITSMSLADVIKKLLAILADALLDSAENLIDTAIDIFVLLVDWSKQVLTATISFPILNELLKDFGVEIEFCLLDIFCLIGAIPATIYYKIATGSAPFSSSDGFSQKIIDASSPQALDQAFNVSFDKDLSNSFKLIHLSAPAQKGILAAGHILGGAATLLGAGIYTINVVANQEDPNFILEITEGVCGLVGAASSGAARLFAQPLPIKNEAVSTANTVFTGCKITAKVAFTGGTFALAHGSSNSAAIKAEGKFAGVIFDAILGGLASIPVCYHLYELAQDEASKDHSIAVMDSVAQLCDNLGKIGKLVVQIAKVAKQPQAVAIAGVATVAVVGIDGTLNIAESIVELA